jgi:hypothetical protein
MDNSSAETKVETTGAPAAIQLTPDHPTINADGEDVSVFTTAVTDAQGRVVPVAANLVHFELSGPGKILGVGNGDPSCHEPDVYLPVWSSHSVAANNGWRWEKTTQPWNASLPEFAASFDDSTWAPADVQSATNQLGDNEHGVFRTHLKVTETELAADAVELCFGTLNGTGKIYVNGQKAGETYDSGVVSAVDVKHLLHPGDNPVAVLIENYSSSGGITGGVTLRMQDKPVLPEWKRSAVSVNIGTKAKPVGLTCWSASPAAQQRRPTTRCPNVVVICYSDPNFFFIWAAGQTFSPPITRPAPEFSHSLATCCDLLALQPPRRGAMTQETSLSSVTSCIVFSAAGGGTYTGLPLVLAVRARLLAWCRSRRASHW